MSTLLSGKTFLVPFTDDIIKWKPICYSLIRVPD